MLYCFLRSTIENNDLVFFVVIVDLYFFRYASLFCVAIYIVQQILISKTSLTVE